jgi:hypothetical protein
MKKLLLSLMMTASSYFVSAQEYVYNYAKSVGTSGYDYLFTSTTDANSNTIFAVESSPTTDYDPGASIYNIASATTGGVVIVKLNNLGNFVWAKALTPNIYAYSMVTDALGNIYITGLFSGTVDFDPSSSVFNMTTLGGQQETFICQFNTNGNLVWAKKFDNVNASSSINYANAIALNSNNEIFVAGLHSGLTDFDPSSNNFNSNIGSSYICKLSSVGNFIWVKEFSSTNGSTQINDIAIVGANDIYLTGEVSSPNYSNVIDADPGPGVVNLNTIASPTLYHIYQSYFTIKLNNGNFSWAFVGGGNDIATDGLGNCYVTGSFRYTQDFDPSPAITNLTSIGFYDGYIVKFNSSGQFQFVNRIGGFNDERVFDVKTDIANNLYVCGRFGGTVNLGLDVYCANVSLTSILSGTSGSTYSYDAFLVKYNQYGGLVFAYKYGGNSEDAATFINLPSNASSITLAGNFSTTADFNPGSGVANLTSIGNADVFINKMVLCTGACTIPSGCRILNPNGNEENKNILNSNLSLFPNPSNGAFTLDLGKEYKQANVRITNVTGKVLAEYQYKDVQKTALQFDGAPGFYWLDITTEEGKLPRMKLMKE